MRNFKTEPVTISEVEAALSRAIESAQWATQKDDVVALTHLKTFIESTNMKTMLYLHLASEQPSMFSAYSANLKNLQVPTIASLYSKAFQGGEARTVTYAEYRGLSKRGSSMYEVSRHNATPVLLYVRMCRGELRGEVNEDNFTLIPKVPEVTQPKKSFWKKLWNQP